jgi:RNA polymerase sigma-70 factor (ECF subfamily)
MPNLHKIRASAVLERVGRGDPRAFDDLVEQYGRLIVWIVRRFLSPRRGDFDDALQDAMVGVWQAAPTYDPSRSSEATFIRMIVHHRMIDRFRRNATKEKTISLDTAPDMIPAPMCIDDHDPHLQAALTRLHPEDRELIELVVIDGMTHAEAARVTGVTASNVKSMVHRALNQLRRELTPTRAKTAA